MAQRGSAPGERRGGRQKGTLNKTLKKIRAKPVKPGLMPVDILLDIARYHHGRALDLRESQARVIEGKPAEDLDITVIAGSIEVEIRSEHAMAASAADKVAPYYHPKLATLQSNVNLTGRLTLEQLVEQSMPLPANSNAVAKLIEGDVDKTAVE